MKAREQLRRLILAVLDRQSEHGYAIAQAINTRSDGLLRAREGTLYPALHALEAEGLIESQEHEVAGRTRREYRLTEKGRTRREYRLTEKGRAALALTRRDWQAQVGAVQAVLGGKA